MQLRWKSKHLSDEGQKETDISVFCGKLLGSFFFSFTFIRNKYDGDFPAPKRSFNLFLENISTVPYLCIYMVLLIAVKMAILKALNFVIYFHSLPRIPLLLTLPLPCFHIISHRKSKCWTASITRMGDCKGVWGMGGHIWQ